VADCFPWLRWQSFLLPRDVNISQSAMLYARELRNIMGLDFLVTAPTFPDIFIPRPN